MYVGYLFQGPELYLVTHSSNQYKAMLRQNGQEPKTFSSSFLMDLLLQLKFEHTFGGGFNESYYILEDIAD